MLLYYASTILVPVVMLNALIAIMGDTFDRVSEMRLERGLLQRAELLVEMERYDQPSALNPQHAARSTQHSARSPHIHRHSPLCPPSLTLISTATLRAMLYKRPECFGGWLHAIRRKDATDVKTDDWSGRLRVMRDDIKELKSSVQAVATNQLAVEAKIASMEAKIMDALLARLAPVAHAEDDAALAA